jgi:hypothetical protein
MDGSAGRKRSGNIAQNIRRALLSEADGCPGRPTVRSPSNALVLVYFNLTSGRPRPIFHTGQLPAVDPTLDGNRPGRRIHGGTI